MQRPQLAAVLAVLACSCVPYKNPPLGDIQKLATLSDVMDSQATIADPMWSKIGEHKYEDKDWAAFRDVSERIQATAGRAKELGVQMKKPPRFGELADKLAAAAAALGKATEAKDADLASQALTDMKATCKTCHSELR